MAEVHAAQPCEEVWATCQPLAPGFTAEDSNFCVADDALARLGDLCMSAVAVAGARAHARAAQLRLTWPPTRSRPRAGTGVMERTPADGPATLLAVSESLTDLAGVTASALHDPLHILYRRSGDAVRKQVEEAISMRAVWSGTLQCGENGSSLYAHVQPIVAVPPLRRNLHEVGLRHTGTVRSGRSSLQLSAQVQLVARRFLVVHRTFCILMRPPKRAC